MYYSFFCVYFAACITPKGIAVWAWINAGVGGGVTTDDLAAVETAETGGEGGEGAEGPPSTQLPL